jgi:hypothetical protein
MSERTLPSKNLLSALRASLLRYAQTLEHLQGRHDTVQEVIMSIEADLEQVERPRESCFFEWEDITQHRVEVMTSKGPGFVVNQSIDTPGLVQVQYHEPKSSSVKNREWWALRRLAPYKGNELVRRVLEELGVEVVVESPVHPYGRPGESDK